MPDVELNDRIECPYCGALQHKQQCEGDENECEKCGKRYEIEVWVYKYEPMTPEELARLNELMRGDADV